MSLTVEQITRALEAIAKDLATRQDPYSKAAEEWIRLDREYERRLISGKLAANADTQTEKKDRALDALAVSKDGIYERHVNAQATFEGQRAAIKVLETRATIGMALLKSQRELGG